MRYPRVVAWLQTQTFLVTPEVAQVIADVMNYRSGRVHESVEAAELRLERTAELREQRIAARSSAGGGSVARSRRIAVLPVFGLLMHRPPLDISGPSGTNYLGLASRFDKARADERVRSIVFEHDSPGGTYGGLPELGEKIRNARGGRKRIVGVSNTLSASASFWLSSQGDELVGTPSSQTGSVGAYRIYENVEGKLAAEGIEPEIIASGRYKTEASGLGALDDDARAHIRAGVELAHRDFTSALAKGRRKPLAEVRGEKFGEGRVYGAAEAMERGMIDRVATLDEVLRELADGEPVLVSDGTEARMMDGSGEYSDAFLDPDVSQDGGSVSSPDASEPIEASLEPDVEPDDAAAAEGDDVDNGPELARAFELRIRALAHRSRRVGVDNPPRSA